MYLNIIRVYTLFANTYMLFFTKLPGLSWCEFFNNNFNGHWNLSHMTVLLGYTNYLDSSYLWYILISFSFEKHVVKTVVVHKILYITRMLAQTQKSLASSTCTSPFVNLKFSVSNLLIGIDFLIQDNVAPKATYFVHHSCSIQIWVLNTSFRFVHLYIHIFQYSTMSGFARNFASRWLIVSSVLFVLWFLP